MAIMLWKQYESRLDGLGTTVLTFLRWTPTEMYQSLCIRPSSPDHLSIEILNEIVDLAAAKLTLRAFCYSGMEILGYHLPQFPEHIDKLEYLEVLYVRFNVIPHMPTTVCQLSNLYALNFECNKLETLPDEIGNLTNLMSLNLAVNNLTTLPTTCTKLTNLVDLLIERNRMDDAAAILIGDIVNRLHKLLRLDISYNNIISENECRKLYNVFLCTVSMSVGQTLYDATNRSMDEGRLKYVDVRHNPGASDIGDVWDWERVLRTRVEKEIRQRLDHAHIARDFSMRAVELPEAPYTLALKEKLPPFTANDWYKLFLCAFSHPEWGISPERGYFYVVSKINARASAIFKYLTKITCVDAARMVVKKSLSSRQFLLLTH